MAPVPTWTKVWRPLAKQLCAHTSDSNAPNEETRRLLSQEELLLRADRVVGQLYAHKFMATVPQDVQQQMEALETKFRVHSQEDRATKLLQLSQHCDYLTLKLLLELATSPTTARDEELQVDADVDSKWKMVLQQKQLKQTQHKQLQDQLVDELFQISTNDEWFQAWEDSEDESDWELSSTDGSERSFSGRQRNGKRTSETLEETNSEQEVMTLLDSRVNSVFGNGKSAKQVEKRRELSKEEKLQDDILCRYHPEIILQDEDVEMKEAEEPTCVLEERELTPFTLDRPWLLCEVVIRSAGEGSAALGITPCRLIHEQTVVSMVFEALDGIDSLLFEFRPEKPTPAIFSVDFQTKTVERRSESSRNVAIGHLSPLALHRLLSDFAQAAAELQLLRDLLDFIRQARNFIEHRCVTLEGLANSLSEVIGNVSDSIRKVEMEMSTTDHQVEDPIPWSAVASRQHTLLGIYGGLKEIFPMISWLKSVLVECFHGLSGRHWYEVKRAEQAKCVLDALYRMMELEYVEGISVDSITAGNFSRSDVLLHLFIGAFTPYLSRINRMIFERGHFDIIPLDGELFFATPASMSVNASPLRERHQSFRGGLLSLAPFEVNEAFVPVFLKSVTKQMNEALASRQLKNRFLQYQQHTLESMSESPQRSLCDLLESELETLGCTRIRRILSVTAAVRQDQSERVASSQHMLECIPFNRILERCLTRHVEIKCEELNGEITDIFRDRLGYLEHVNALRMFVLMEQQDVFSIFSEKMVAHMQKNPVAWADSEKLNSFHQSAVQGVFEDNSLSFSQRQIGDKLSIRVDFSLLDSGSSSARIDVATMKCMRFTFAPQQPLRVLFSASIMQKYSRLGVFLVQVKAVESALVKFKSTLRHRRCFEFIDDDMRQLLIQMADMLHYTKSLLSYLTSQVSSEGWSTYFDVLQSSRSLEEMNATHEKYLDHLLSHFFLLDKHVAVIQYILTTFNHILRFVGQVDEFVSALDRNFQKYFPQYVADDGEEPLMAVISSSSTHLLDHPDFRALRTELTRSSKEFKRQSHFLVVMLTAMQKHGASPHVNEIVTQLNYNYFYHEQEQRTRVQVPLPQNQPINETKQAPPLNRSGSLNPPPAPKRVSRSRSVKLPWV